MRFDRLSLGARSSIYASTVPGTLYSIPERQRDVNPVIDHLSENRMVWLILDSLFIISLIIVFLIHSLITQMRTQLEFDSMAVVLYVWYILYYTEHCSVWSHND